MYSQTDLTNIKRQMSRRMLAIIGFLFCMIAVLAFFVVNRFRIPAYTLGILTCFAAVFLIDMIYMPLWRYAHFVEGILTGNRRELDGIYLKASDEISMIDGVAFKSILVSEQHSDEYSERLFYYDILKEVPLLETNDRVRIIYQDRQIIGIEKQA